MRRESLSLTTMKQTQLVFTTTGQLAYRAPATLRASPPEHDVAVQLRAKYPYLGQTVYYFRSSCPAPANQLSSMYTSPLHIRPSDVLECMHQTWPNWVTWLGEGRTFPSLEHAWFSLKALTKPMFDQFTSTGALSQFPKGTTPFRYGNMYNWKYWEKQECIGILAKVAVMPTTIKKYKLPLTVARPSDNRTIIDTMLLLIRLKMEQDPICCDTLLSTHGLYLLKYSNKAYEQSVKTTPYHDWCAGDIYEGKLYGLNMIGIYHMVVRDQLLAARAANDRHYAQVLSQPQTLHAKYYPGIIDAETASSATRDILSHWPTTMVSGKRNTLTLGEPGIVYTVSFRDTVIERRTQPWDTLPWISQLRTQIESLLTMTFNVCVVQVYPHGKVGIKPHRDKEIRPGQQGYIVGLSLGQPRYLGLTHAKSGQKRAVLLDSGSLYVLMPPTNQYWQHSIERDGSTDPRISLTFRTY